MQGAFEVGDGGDGFVVAAVAGGAEVNQRAAAFGLDHAHGGVEGVAAGAFGAAGEVAEDVAEEIAAVHANECGSDGVTK